MRSGLVSLVLLLLFSACGNENADNNELVQNIEEIDTAAVVKNAEIEAARARAARIAACLDDRLLAAQTLITGIDGRGTLTGDMRILLGECPAGGVILFRYNLNTGNDAIRSLIAGTASLITDESGIYPFVSVDHEGGMVNRFPPGVAALPAALGYWNLAQQEGREAALYKIEEDSFGAGREINSFGFNLNFAPVAEYLNVDNSDFLESRSYGPDPFFVTEAAAAFVRGMDRAGVLCAAKHFPGSAGADPHRFPSVIHLDKENLDALIAPFAALADGNVRALMVCHSLVPVIDSEHIASLSAKIMGNWLRRELGFEGVIISDDFSMAAAAGTSRLSPEAAAIRSLAAGADMVLVWPPDLRRTHRALLAALEDGRLSRDRLREAASRVIFEKITMGLFDDEE